MSSSAKFVPTLGGRVWRLQRQGAQAINSVIKSSSSEATATNSSFTVQKTSTASYSTGSAWGSSPKQAWNNSSSWSQRK